MVQLMRLSHELVLRRGPAHNVRVSITNNSGGSSFRIDAASPAPHEAMSDGSEGAVDPSGDGALDPPFAEGGAGSPPVAGHVYHVAPAEVDGAGLGPAPFGDDFRADAMEEDPPEAGNTEQAPGSDPPDPEDMDSDSPGEDMEVDPPESADTEQCRGDELPAGHHVEDNADVRDVDAMIQSRVDVSRAGNVEADASGDADVGRRGIADEKGLNLEAVAEDANVGPGLCEGAGGDPARAPPTDVEAGRFAAADDPGSAPSTQFGIFGDDSGQIDATRRAARAVVENVDSCGGQGPAGGISLEVCSETVAEVLVVAEPDEDEVEERGRIPTLRDFDS
jgi:hypothetical protein